MKKSTQKKPRNTFERENVVPLFGKDEMNLIEFPFGPISPNGAKTLEVEHEIFDKSLGRGVVRQLIITGADAFGLPGPIDDQVLVGMKALTYDAGIASQEVKFSRYELCRAIGWEPDGRAYKRLEESFDRIAGTTLKFKNSWWDKGDKAWKSETFHLIERVSLCSRDQLDRKRLSTGVAQQKLCSFVWSDVVWKSLQDGYIKTLDMNMFRKIAQGGKRDVALRLFRVLDKRFFFGHTARFELQRLCIGTLGLSPTYGPFEMYRILERAAQWLIDCKFLESMSIEGSRLSREAKLVFSRYRQSKRRTAQFQQAVTHPDYELDLLNHKAWLTAHDDNDLLAEEVLALSIGFGTALERKLIAKEKTEGKPLRESGRLRTDYVRRWLDSRSKLGGPSA